MNEGSRPEQEGATQSGDDPHGLSSSPPDVDIPPTDSASPYLSPPNQIPYSNRQFSSSTRYSGESGHSDSFFDSSNNNTPLLNGENIVLLSYSNDTTPVNRDHGLNNEDENVSSSPRDLLDQSQLDRNNNRSPPPESIQSGKLTTLSPPPLSLKSSGSAPPATEGKGLFGNSGSHGKTGAQRPTADLPRDPNNPQPNPPTVGSAGMNIPSSVGGGPKKKRPPLPPRWAIGLSNPPSQQGNVAVDVLPSHLPPPKQIGPVSHRRVVSTGDVSFLSNLTDTDSVQDVDESPPSRENIGTVMYVPTASGYGVAASTSGVSHLAQPFLTTNKARRRGVSWDFGVSGGDMDEANEERSAFEAMGIMQPVLGDDDGEDSTEDVADLVQPVLLNEGARTNSDKSKFSELIESAPSDEAVQSKSVESREISNGEGSTNPHPESKSGTSAWDKVRLSRKKISQMSGIRPEKDGTQFENEAELAILEAMGVQVNVDSFENEVANIEDTSHDSPVDGVADEKVTENIVDDVPSIVSSQNPFHQKNVSSITMLHPLEDNHSPANIHHLNQKGLMIFEDQGWHDGYDAKGRIDGTLREEQDAKLVEEGLGIKLDEMEAPNVGVDRGPDHPMPSPTHSDSSKKRGSNFLKPLALLRGKTDTSVKVEKHKANEDDSPSITPKHDEDESQDVKEGDADRKEKKSQESHLRHRRNKTRHVDIASELAKLALPDDMSSDNKHKRTTTHMTYTHGIDNLLDGVDLLYKQSQDEKEKKYAQSDDEDSATPGNSPADDEENGDNGDEELGHAQPKRHDGRKKASFVRATGKKKSRSSRSESFYHIRRWYIDLIEPKIPFFIQGVKHGVLLVIAPLLTLAFILYYPLGNPMAGSINRDGISILPASWSWWVLFIVRQFFVLSCVKAGEVITIDIFALRTPYFVKTFGSFATLMLVQARGWPYVVAFWGLMDFCFLFGSHPFAKHWLFWQNWLGMFNSSNPGGSFISDLVYLRILVSMIVIGSLTSLKRLWLATFLGRRSYIHFGPDLEVILAKMLLISQVAHLSRQIEAQIVSNTVSDGYAFVAKSLPMDFHNADSDSEEFSPPQSPRTRFQSSDGSSGRDVTTEGVDGFGRDLLAAGIKKTGFSRKSMKQMGSSSKLEVMTLLEEWEEPSFESASRASITDILQFRQAISLMNDDFCFTPAFGRTTTRASCVDSSEALFDRLVDNDPNAILPFETLAQLAYDKKGLLMRDKVKALIKLFRPDRQGYMTKLDFVSSIDSVYKDLRLFRASLQNSSQVDDSIESILNLLFYIFLCVVVLLVMGFQMWESLLSFATFFFGFSFMFGPAASKYFEGLLLILVRRPYDIGDKIALSNPDEDTSPSGSSTWFVEEVSLFTTTVRFASTNEVATYSNGSLARLRIINAKRSPKAILYVHMKFGADAPYQKIKVFRTAIENFIKARPREWAQLNGIRATRVEMELNYVEYVIVATHREMWQNIGPILTSRADLSSFSLEVSKKLNLRYQNPPKPVHLSVDPSASGGNDSAFTLSAGHSSELKAVADLFLTDE